MEEYSFSQYFEPYWIEKDIVFIRYFSLIRMVSQDKTVCNFVFFNIDII